MIARRLDTVMIAAGLACLTIYALANLQTAFYQHRANTKLEAMIAANHDDELPSFNGSIPKAERIGRPLQHGELIGRVEVPRLGISAAIAEGDDAGVLSTGVGHLPDTALPWQPRGNAAFAAHRDTLFRPLKDIRAGDEIRVVTPQGAFRYRVRDTRVVNPDDVSVLSQTPSPTVTLITCYPFYFIGHAPHRFIVHADRIESALPGVALKGTVVH